MKLFFALIFGFSLARQVTAQETNSQTVPDPIIKVEQESVAELVFQVTLDPSELLEFDQQSIAIQNLIRNALNLAAQKLDYKYGSADPSLGGMDCSGTVHYLLNQSFLKAVPRQSDEFYKWVRKKGLFKAVISLRPTFELDELKPGDLLFWTGTYEVQREIPVTHVMIYLGTEKKRNQRVMIGASNGRQYQSRSRFGVSVFDFNPSTTENAKGRFIGFSSIPGLN